MHTITLTVKIAGMEFSMNCSFLDDYSESAHPEILKAILHDASTQQLSYGADSHSQRAIELIKKRFNIPSAQVYFVPTGTAANIVCLQSMLRPFEAIIATKSAHIQTMEAGAIEATGHKILVATDADKLTPSEIVKVVQAHSSIHTVRPRVVYISQSTEGGRVYSLREIAAIASVCRRFNLYLYVDGARLPMALAQLDKKNGPECFAKSGADVFSIGGTKNGCMYGEAIVVINPVFFDSFWLHIKQRGFLMSKSRYFGLQFERLFTDDLWLELASKANMTALRLYNQLIMCGLEVEKPQVNQTFLHLPASVVEELEKRYRIFRWGNVEGENIKIRLTCSWATSESQIIEFVAFLRQCIGIKS